MKKSGFILLAIMILTFTTVVPAAAQCSICTKTVAQLGEKPARGFNSGIIYLMLTPFAVAGYIGFRWWRSEQENEV